VPDAAGSTVAILVQGAWMTMNELETNHPLQRYYLNEIPTPTLPLTLPLARNLTLTLTYPFPCPSPSPYPYPYPYLYP